ncbi:MAG: hypothetical protein WCQ00_00160 [bacterium]
MPNLKEIITNPFWVLAIIFLGVLIVSIFRKKQISIKTPEVSVDGIHLDRNVNNPVISPSLLNKWENIGTFNPAIIKDDDGVVHMLYRAVGDDGLSRIGYANSQDGIVFDERYNYPVYVSVSTFCIENECEEDRPHFYNPMVYASGGGWGGTEDPRAVVIGDRIYMTYTAFEGWGSVRMALTSISMEDFKKGKWNWKKPKFISSAKDINKNWVLFPEKLNGKFAVIHSISPEIRIGYIDDIDRIDEEFIQSSAPSGGREDQWDNWVRGAGSPPIRTEIGWLLLYHAMDKSDPNKYKLGCMILDFEDPTKILYRSPSPILEPVENYENDEKPGVVYASGAILQDDDLYVYYGGGDKHVCVAKTPLKPLLDWLVTYGKV